jgi:hypothetical protein
MSSVSALPNVQVRVSPQGMVAQRFDRDFNGKGNWLVTVVSSGKVQVVIHSDAQVEKWSPMRVKGKG